MSSESFDSQDPFLMIPEDWARDPAVYAASQALPLYLYLSSASYFRKHAENYQHVGPWVKKQLVVCRFRHADFVQHCTQMGIEMSERTSKRHLQLLVEGGFVRVLQQANGTIPTSLLAIGCWVEVSAGGARIKFLGRHWWERQSGLPETVKRELTGRSERIAEKQARQSAATQAWAAWLARNRGEKGQAVTAGDGLQADENLLSAKNGT